MPLPRDPDRHAPSCAGCLSALLPAAVFIWLAAQMPRLTAGKALTVGLDWVPSLGVDVALRLDGLSSLFALIISAVGAVVLLYAGAYMSGHKGIGRLYGFLHAFLFSMLGLVFSDNLLLMFVFWELTTLFSFFL